MKLLNFTAKNLFSLGDIKLDLKDKGLILITGFSEDDSSGNGSGKSSLANKGILWGLYGLTPGGLKADKVINRFTKGKTAKASIEFEGIDGKIYQVIRERPAKLTLLEGDKDLSLKKTSGTQELINKLLGRDFETFIQSNFFGQGNKLNYASLAPKEQKAILEQILPIEKIDNWFKYTHEKIKDVQELKDKHNITLNRLDAQYDAFNSTLNGCYIRLNEWKVNQGKKKQIILNQIESYKTESVQVNKQIENITQQINEFNKEEVEVELNELELKFKENESAWKETDKLLKEANKSLHGWTAKIKGYEAQELDTESIEKKVCPVCFSVITDETQTSLKERMKNLKAIKNEAAVNKGLANEACNHYSKLYNDYSLENNNLKSKINSTRNKILNYHRLKESLNTYEKQLDNKIPLLESELNLIEKEKNPYIQEADEALANVEKIKKELKKAKIRMNTLTSELSSLKFWENIFKNELKLKLFESACPFLDERTAYHLERLRNKQFHVEFSTVKRLASGDVKEDFNVHVWNENGGDGFDSLSGGEQQIVSFAIGLALADLSATQVKGHSSFLILDEPFTELDERNCEAVVDYLMNDIAKTKDTILLISNDENLKQLIPNRIHVVKKHGVSTITEG